ncbi:MAG TPA: T9SS type A sorting domain-containing protein, partial [Saprospiraceae bacterium]
ISAVNVIRTPSESMRLEVIRLMNLMAELPDKWIPARQDGKEVAMRFTLPIKFMLQDDRTKIMYDKRQMDTPTSDPNDTNTTVTVTSLRTNTKNSNSDHAANNTLVKTISVVPNPATESITVELIEGAHTVNIFGLSGNIVLTHKVVAKSSLDKESINVSALSAGQFAVQVLSSNGTATGSFTIVK